MSGDHLGASPLYKWIHGCAVYALPGGILEGVVLGRPILGCSSISINLLCIEITYRKYLRLGLLGGVLYPLLPMGPSASPVLSAASFDCD